MKKIFIIILICLFCFSGTYVIGSNKSNPISMKEAYNIAVKDVNRWDSNAKLYYITSVDMPNIDSISKQLSGKRRIWNLTFSVPNSTKHCLITIIDGKVENINKVTALDCTEQLIDFENICINSTDIINNAKKYYDLKPGKIWAKGYHFVLEKDNTNIVLKILGLNKNNQFTKLHYDAKTGKLLYEEHKSLQGGGLYKNNLVTNDLERLSDDLNVINLTVSPNSIDEKLLLTLGYSKDNQSQILRLSNLDNQEVYDIKMEDAIIKAWFSNNYNNDKKIIISTHEHLYTFSSDDKVLTNIYNYSQNIIKIIYHEESIALLTKKSIEISDDNGLSWTNLNNNLSINKIMFNNIGELLAISDKEIIKLENNIWYKLYKNPNGKILDCISINDNLFIATNNTITVFKELTGVTHIIDTSNNIYKIFLDYDYALNHCFFVWTKGNDLIKIKKVGEDYEQEKLSINIPPDGLLTNITSGSKETFYYGLRQAEKWIRSKGE